MTTREQVVAALSPDEIDYPTVAAGLGAEALPAVQELIAGGRPDLAAKAASLAGYLSGPGQVEALEAAAGAADPTVRLAAASGLRRLPEAELERLVPRLLDDSDVAVRKQAVLAATPASHVPSVREALRRVAAEDPFEDLRVLAVERHDLR